MAFPFPYNYSFNGLWTPRIVGRLHLSTGHLFCPPAHQQAVPKRGPCKRSHRFPPVTLPWPCCLVLSLVCWLFGLDSDRQTWSPKGLMMSPIHQLNAMKIYEKEDGSIIQAFKQPSKSSRFPLGQIFHPIRDEAISHIPWNRFPKRNFNQPKALEFHCSK